MTPQEAIQKLYQLGMGQVEIARRVTEQGAPTTQTTIMRVGTGAIENPRFDLGTAIVAVCAAVVAEKSKSKKHKSAA